ncbi:hypothetical protein, partial [Vibrio parahaemolyticus]|uniref:hypothetical protein n=1 Tax=Vibrio parahaemolyticus TaxID=670 RepID=UPI00111F3026
MIQGFEPTMLICRKLKNELLKRLNLEKPKNFTLSHNAQLRGEQRLHSNLKHCAINTKFEVEA